MRHLQKIAALSPQQNSAKFLCCSSGKRHNWHVWKELWTSTVSLRWYHIILSSVRLSCGRTEGCNHLSRLEACESDLHLAPELLISCMNTASSWTRGSWLGLPRQNWNTTKKFWKSTRTVEEYYFGAFFFSPRKPMISCTVLTKRRKSTEPCCEVG